MATINATLTIGSGDLLTSNTAFSVASTLSKAGSANGLTKTSGLARTNFLSTDPASRSKILYRADDAATNGSNKVYLKNLSTTVTEFFTVYIDQEEMGRLYAGDFAFFPWSATQGTLETFVVTIGGTWVAGETWSFDGITTAAETTVVAAIAVLIDAQHYPNWTTSITGAAVTFTARHASVNGVVTAADAVTGDVIVQGGGSDATGVISAGAAGTRSEADIVILPSVATTMDLEHMLFNE